MSLGTPFWGGGMACQLRHPTARSLGQCTFLANLCKAKKLPVQQGHLLSSDVATYCPILAARVIPWQQYQKIRRSGLGKEQSLHGIVLHAASTSW